jgi:RHS repeat-associated protein
MPALPVMKPLPAASVTETPFGNLFYSSNSLTDVNFTGHRLDGSDGLIYAKARHYDPVIGKWLTPDTVVQAPYDPQFLNRMTYCRSNPINLLDPSGRTTQDNGGNFDIVQTGYLDYTVTIHAAPLNGQMNFWRQDMAGFNEYIQRLQTDERLSESIRQTRMSFPQDHLQHDPIIENTIMMAPSMYRLGAGVVDLSVQGFRGAAGGWEALGNAGRALVGGGAGVAAKEGLAASGTDFIVSPSGTVVEKAIVDKWARGTFENVVDSMEYHFGKHGSGRTLEQYTDDALGFFEQNRGEAQWGKWSPNWEPAYRLKLGSQGGYFTSEGSVITYWDE